MKKYLTFIRLIVIALIVIVLGALFGWYYFLEGKNQQTSAQDTGTGYGTAAPTFTGSAGSTYANVVSTLGQDSGVTSASSTSRLWEVSSVPVAGFSWRKGSSGDLYFVERSSGYVFDAQTSGRAVTRLTDTLRPKIYQAYVMQDGSIVERSVDDNGTLITFAGNVASTSASTSSTMDLVGADLPANIGAVAADPISDTLFYTVPKPSGISMVSSSVSGTKEKQLFSSPIVGWKLFAPGDGTLVIEQDPLDDVTGYAYQLQKSGTLSLIAKGLGLTVLPRPASTALIFGSSANGQLSLYSQASASAGASRLPIRTVADKCAWAPGTALIAYCAVPQSESSPNFLDDWYKGLIHTSDTFYALDAAAASTSVLYDPSGDTSAQFDVEDVSVDPTGEYLAFIDARDQSLWVLRIAQ